MVAHVMLEHVAHTISAFINALALERHLRNIGKFFVPEHFLVAVANDFDCSAVSKEQ
jgi:hypothetical protein